MYKRQGGAIAGGLAGAGLAAGGLAGGSGNTNGDNYITIEETTIIDTSSNTGFQTKPEEGSNQANGTVPNTENGEEGESVWNTGFQLRPEGETDNQNQDEEGETDWNTGYQLPPEQNAEPNGTVVDLNGNNTSSLTNEEYNLGDTSFQFPPEESQQPEANGTTSV